MLLILDWHGAKHGKTKSSSIVQSCTQHITARSKSVLRLMELNILQNSDWVGHYTEKVFQEKGWSDLRVK